MNDKIKLKDACKILNGFAFKSGKYVDSGIRIIRIANVQKGYVEDERPAFYPNSEESSIRDYMLEEDDLLLSLTGNVGRVALLDKRWLPAALNQRVACLRIKDDRIIKDYLYFALLSDKFENDCTESSKGIAQKNMSTEWLKDYEIPLPSGQKQREIISSLKQLSMIIKNKTEQIQQLNDLIKARFIEMFENDNMNEKTIEDVASFCSRGKSPKYVTESKLKVINQACIYWDRFKLENVKYNEEDYDGDRIISNNDLLICSTGTGTLGRCNIFRAPDDSRYMADSHVTIIRLNGHILPEVFKAWFERSRTQEKLYSDCVSGSTNQIELSKEKLKNMNILVPPINLQKQFASFAKQVDKSKFVLSNELTMCDFYIRLIHDRVMHGRINLRVAQ